MAMLPRLAGYTEMHLCLLGFNRLKKVRAIHMKLFVVTFLGVSVLAGAAYADGDAAKGEQVFKKCMACHTVADKANKVGPSLLGIVGSKVGVAEGYTYSDSMKEFAATGAVWDEKTLDTYLTNPKALVGHTKMAFPGLKQEADRADLIAYLKTKM